MTLPAETQRANQIELLRRLLEATGEKYALDHFATNDPQFADILPTSWVHLANRDYLKAVHQFGNPGYQFTPAGWLKALEVTGALGTRAIAERAEKLLRAIKARVERDAHHAALLDEHEISAETGIPIGWVYNALASNLLDTLYPDRGYEVEHEYGRRSLFRAPVIFGHRPETGI